MALSIKDPEADRLARELALGESLTEAATVVQARPGDPGERALDLLTDSLGTEVVSVTTPHAEVARAAFRRFGKGRHPAGLN